MIEGKPVFSADDTNSQSGSTPGAPQDSGQPMAASQPKSIPTVVVSRVEYDINGSNMDLAVELNNNSEVEVMLDKIRLLSRTFELDRPLKAGESREFTVYRGPRPNNTHDTRCEVQYRDPTGDYFSAIHYMHYDQLSDGMWVVNEMRFIPPIKDV